MPRLLPPLLLACLLAVTAPGCAYRIGAGVTAGALDELGGDGKSAGLEGTADALAERALLVELGHQLGAGLSSGATEVTPEQRARLEETIDGLLTVAARRTGKGLRNEVSPELREMVTKDIVGAFSDGLRDDLGDSLEDTVDRVVTRAVVSLRDNLGDEQTRWMLSDLIRDSVYFAMRETQATPAVAETLETTITENVLAPVEQSVGGITDVVASQVEASARRTENTLKGIISVLVLVSSVFFMLYLIRNRQVRSLQEQAQVSERGLRNVDAALDLLDEGSRAAVLAKLAEYQHVEEREVTRTQPPPPERSDDYLR
jgi:hypothetical protein